MTDLKTPMCDKLSAADAQRETVTEFLDWLQAQGMVICKAHQHTDACRAPHEHDEDCRQRNGIWRGLYGTLCPTTELVCGSQDGEYYSVHEHPAAMIFRFLEIDPKQLEAERRAILETLR